MALQQWQQRAGERWGLIGLLILAWLVRLPRLSWQPLWWDEGYSVYFATEPVRRMLALTAADIHPPLYYTLLHLWLAFNQNVQPATLRLFSAWMGVAGVALLIALARALYPDQPRVAWIAGLLLALNPLHLFYSQEIRMYGMALVAGLATTLSFWHLWIAGEQNRPVRLLVIVYGLAVTAALYTLYYLALLVLAHALWAAWHYRRTYRRMLPIVCAYGLIGLLYLPWLFYSLPQLMSYVVDKIPADADRSLGPLAYGMRHWLAFTSGHLQAASAPVQVARWLAAAAVPLALFAMRKPTINGGMGALPFPKDNHRVRELVSPVSGRTAGLSGQRPDLPIRQQDLPKRDKRTSEHRTPVAWQTPSLFLATCFSIPMLVAFGLNLRLPFFPEGGERLLLFILPYGLLLLAALIERGWQTLWLGPAALAGLLLGAATGGWIFYTLPRYSEHDYRPLIRQVVQQSSNNDTVLAIFPWTVGYWRVYSAETACQSERRACTLRRGIDELGGPHLRLLSDRALQWSPALKAVIDGALAEGTLWFPAPLSFGSTLPAEIERYLVSQAVNLENRWFTPTTRLSAWHRLPGSTPDSLVVDFGPVRLVSTGISSRQVPSANQPVAIQLTWAGVDLNNLGATVRLIDEAGRTWANRTYAPLGSLSHTAAGEPPMDEVGLLIPTGLPPATYTVAVGVVVSGTEALLSPARSADALAQVVPVSTLVVTSPPVSQPAYRLPMQETITPSLVDNGVALLGVTGIDTNTEVLAGEALDLTLFLQAKQASPPTPLLSLRLLSASGESASEWQVGPPTSWPASSWAEGTLVQIPASLGIPATLPAGEYRLVSGFVGSANGQTGATAPLGRMIVDRRPTNLTAPVIPNPLAEPIQFGTHVRLLGYDEAVDGETLTLRLYWQVLQTLLPPHHIFVHLEDASGTLLAQADGPPLTASGRAPTGSWLPGEYLVTEHQLSLGAAPSQDSILHVGLYQPQNGIRLPAFKGDQPAGDSAELPLPP